MMLDARIPIRELFSFGEAGAEVVLLYSGLHFKFKAPRSFTVDGLKKVT